MPRRIKLISTASAGLKFCSSDGGYCGVQPTGVAVVFTAGVGVAVR